MPLLRRERRGSSNTVGLSQSDHVVRRAAQRCSDEEAEDEGRGKKGSASERSSSGARVMGATASMPVRWG
eukprot:6093259-Alexandrium_andersonii.AAC.1